jgi:hypothetical protein
MTYYAIHFNRPDFIKIQYKLACRTNDNLIVVNNGNNETVTRVCDELNVNCISIENSTTTDPSYSHGHAINTILPHINMSEDWGLLDHDMFMVQKIRFDSCDIISHIHHGAPNKIPYLWPGMLLCRGGVDLKHIDFRPIVKTEPETISWDTGSDTHTIMNRFKIDGVGVSIVGDSSVETRVQDICSIAVFNYKNNIIGYHYINGSNWSGQNKTEEKNKMLSELISLGV